MYLIDTFEGFDERDIKSDKKRRHAVNFDDWSGTSVDYVLARMQNISSFILKTSTFFFILFFIFAKNILISLSYTIRLHLLLIFFFKKQVQLSIASTITSSFFNHKSNAYIPQYMLIGAIVNFILNTFLITNFKASGAALATTVAEAVVTAFNSFYYYFILFQP